MPYEWQEFTDYLDGERVIRKEERDELWEALAWLLENCGGRYQLNGVDMTAIRESLFITDLTSVDDTEGGGDPVRGNLAAVLIAIRDIFTGQTGLDAFKAVAGDEDLTEEQLAEFVGESGRATEVETFHLWNLYKRVLDFLTCCPTGAPTFQWDTRSASKSKVGEAEFGEPSNPPRRYRRKEARLEYQINLPGDYPPTFYNVGSKRTRLPAVVTVGVTKTTTYDDDGTPTVDTETDDPVATDITEDTTIRNSCTSPEETDTYTGTATLSGPTFAESGMTVVDTTHKTQSDDVSPLFSSDNGYSSLSAACAGGEPDVDGYWGNQLLVGSATLSEEDTTAALKARTVAALPALDGDWDDTPGLLYFLSADELTFNLRDGPARIPVAGKGFVVGRTYRAVYFWRAQPLPSGTPSDGEEEYKEFTFVEGMEHVEVTMPGALSTNVELLLVGVRWECAPFA